MADERRRLPSVDRLLREPGVRALLGLVPRNLVVGAIRAVLERARTRRSGLPAVDHDWAEEVADAVKHQTTPSLQPVLNASGVVLHTNLGRAPLAEAASAAIQAVAQGYSSLEYDLASGTRGHRADHCRTLLAELTGADDGLAVNNAAGALTLALNALAEGRPVLISRGELIEIGGSFRIPEILQKSGAVLREVGTTNRTHLDDYRRALDGAALILTVHRSNFEQRGFVTTPAPDALAGLAHEARIAYVYDVGSGLLADLSNAGLTSEPRVTEAVRTGADLVIFSGDKLLGGPQAGCLVGRTEPVRRCRANPLARALRADKFTLAGLEATLALYRDPAEARRQIPVLVMLTMDPDALERRASMLAALCPAALNPQAVPGESAVGGGAFPGASLPTTLVALDPGSLGADGLALRLRVGRPPIVTRVANGRVLLDPRTLPETAFGDVAAALSGALDD